MAAHLTAENQGACDIIVIILQRLAHGFPHCLKTCKMDDRINFLLVKHFFKGRLVQKVCLVELYLPACYLLYSLQCLLAGVIKVVHYNHIITRCQQFHTGMASDIAGATSH